MQGYAETLWGRTRLLRIGFIAGLAVGLLAGWFFHGVISLVVRFFFVIVLLVPFVIAVFAWWRLRQQASRYRTSRTGVDEWPAPMSRTETRSRSDEPVNAGAVITVESWETRDASERRGARRRGPDG